MRTGSWTGPPRGKRASRVGISSTVFGVRDVRALIFRTESCQDHRRKGALGINNIAGRRRKLAPQIRRKIRQKSHFFSGGDFEKRKPVCGGQGALGVCGVALGVLDERGDVPVVDGPVHLQFSV